MKITIDRVEKKATKDGKPFWLAHAGDEEYFIWDKAVADKLSGGGEFEVAIDETKPEYPKIIGVKPLEGAPSKGAKPLSGNGEPTRRPPDQERRIVRQTCLKVAGEIVAATVPKFPGDLEEERTALFKVLADLTRGLATGFEKWVYRDEAEAPK